MRPCASVGWRARGFTLIEVMVALMVVALGLTALMVAVSGAARTSSYLREKTLAEWIAMNRLSEVRLNTTKFGQNTDVAEISSAGRTWHYDTRYFDTSVSTMKRVVVRVYAGAKTAKGNPLAEASGFTGTALSTPGSSNVDWSAGATAATATPAGTTTTGSGTTTGTGTTTTTTTGTTSTTGTSGTGTSSSTPSSGSSGTSSGTPTPQ